MVTSLLANKVKDVGLDVEAAESVQVPVGLDGGDLGVVVVVVGISGADERVRHSITDNQAENAVTLCVSLGLVECDEDQSTIPEAGLLVIDQRLEEIAAPLSSNGDGGVVTIACLRSCQYNSHGK